MPLASQPVARVGAAEEEVVASATVEAEAMVVVVVVEEETVEVDETRAYSPFVTTGTVASLWTLTPRCKPQ